MLQARSELHTRVESHNQSYKATLKVNHKARILIIVFDILIFLLDKNRSLSACEFAGDLDLNQWNRWKSACKSIVTDVLYLPIKCQSCHHIETSQLICRASQLTGFYMMATLAFNELRITANFLESFIFKWKNDLGA